MPSALSENVAWAANTDGAAMAEHPPLSAPGSDRRKLFIAYSF